MKTPQKLLLTVAFSTLLACAASAQIASDNAGNYPGEVWTTGSNGGSGFGAWIFSSTNGTGSGGVFIGDPSAAGISGMSATSFGFYANPLGSGANAGVSRPLSSALQAGQTFSFQWGLNWDSDSPTSNRGFNLRAGETELLNLNMSNSSVVTIQGSPMFNAYGTQAFTVNFEQVTESSIRVYGVGRNGTETYDNTFTGLTGAADNFAFYFNATSVPVSPEDQANRQMYVNNLSVVPEPTTYALIALGAAFVLWRVRRRVTSGA
jgi:hypothetical protein